MRRRSSQSTSLGGQLPEVLRIAEGLRDPCTVKWESDKLWDVEDPVMTPYKVAAKLGQAPGFAGPPNAKAQEGLSKYIITDMYAKAVQRHAGRGVREGPKPS